MKIQIESAGKHLYRYESQLKDYGSSLFTDEWGDEKAVIEIKSLLDLKELSKKLNRDLIIANPYDEYHLSNKRQVELAITIYDDYIE